MRVALFFLLLLTTLLEASGPKILYLKEYSVPSSAYKGSVFPVHIKLLVLDSDFELRSSFENSSFEVLNPKKRWKSEGENLYSITYLLKAKGSSTSTPSINISILKDGTTLDNLHIGEQEIDVVEVEVEDFSGVFAKSLKPEEFKAAIFDETSNILIFELSAVDSNLQDFNLKKFEKQGLESFSGNYNASELVYYVMVDKKTDELKFKYFDTDKKKFLEVVYENKPTDERVSTQSDLKPKNTFLFTKIILSILLVSLFIGLYVFKRRKIFIVLAFLVGVAMLFFLFEKGSIIIKKGTKIQILPTDKSTAFYTTRVEREASLLAEKEQFIKIELDNKIGWIRRSDTKN